MASLDFSEYDLIKALALITKASPSPTSDESGNLLSHLQLQTFAIHQRILDTSFFNPDNLSIDIKQYQYKDYFYSRLWDGAQNGKIKIEYPVLSYHRQNEFFNNIQSKSILNFQILCTDTYNRKIDNGSINPQKLTRTREEVLAQLRNFLIYVIKELSSFAKTYYFANVAPTVILNDWLPTTLTKSPAFLNLYTVQQILPAKISAFIGNNDNIEMGEFVDSSHNELLHYVANLSVNLTECLPLMPLGSYDVAFISSPNQTETT